MKNGEISRPTLKSSSYNLRSPLLLVAVILALASGIIQAALLKYQNRQIVPSLSPNCIGKELSLNKNNNPACQEHFKQAFLQTVFVFLGEAACLLIYWGWKWSNRRVINDLIPLNSTGVTDLEMMRLEELAAERDLMGYSSVRSAPIWWWMTPAPIDFLESVFSHLALVITYASTVHMLHNFMLVTAAIFSMVMFRKPLKVHEWLGCFLVTFALICSGIPAILYPEDATDTHSSAQWIGILLALLGTCAHAFQNVWEEALFSKGKIGTFLAVGVEGLAGLGISMCILPFIEWFKWEYPSRGIRQTLANSNIMHTTILFVLASLVNNASGIIVTRKSSGVLRCLFMAVRPPLLWGLEMALGWNIFHWYYLCGMVILVIGISVHILSSPVAILVGSKGRTLLTKPVPCFCVTDMTTTTTTPTTGVSGISRQLSGSTSGSNSSHVSCPEDFSGRGSVARTTPLTAPDSWQL